MRAVVVEEFGPVDSHKLGEVPAPTPGPGEVLLDVHAIGVNFPDSLMVQGLYQIKPERPFTPGRDAAGVVTAVGDGVTRVKAGDRVTTLYTFGAYAEQRVVPEARWDRPSVRLLRSLLADRKSGLRQDLAKQGFLRD